MTSEVTAVNSLGLLALFRPCLALPYLKVSGILKNYNQIFDIEDQYWIFVSQLNRPSSTRSRAWPLHGRGWIFEAGRFVKSLHLFNYASLGFKLLPERQHWTVENSKIRMWSHTAISKPLCALGWVRITRGPRNPKVNIWVTVHCIARGSIAAWVKGTVSCPPAGLRWNSMHASSQADGSAGWTPESCHSFQRRMSLRRVCVEPNSRNQLTKWALPCRMPYAISCHINISFSICHAILCYLRHTTHYTVYSAMAIQGQPYSVECRVSTWQFPRKNNKKSEWKSLHLHT